MCVCVSVLLFSFILFILSAKAFYFSLSFPHPHNGSCRQTWLCSEVISPEIQAVGRISQRLWPRTQKQWFMRVKVGDEASRCSVTQLSVRLQRTSWMAHKTKGRLSALVVSLLSSTAGNTMAVAVTEEEAAQPHWRTFPRWCFNLLQQRGWCFHK